MKNNKWCNYFIKIQNKYNLSLNINKPIVIFLDGKNITKSLNHNLMQESKNSFNDIFEQTIKYFTEEFECIGLSGVDEVSFIFENGRKIKEKLRLSKLKTHDIISIFSQLFYKYFNDRYSSEKIYWHCKCSNIPVGKVNSYINFRSLTINELFLTYFLKRKNVQNAGKIRLTEKQKICNEIEEFKKIEKFSKGKLYKNGMQIDLEEFFNNKIIEIPEIEREEGIRYIDIANFEW